jgi:nitrate reductase gamma subunit
VASSTGTGRQTVSWKVRNGSWRIVVMNADGSPRVATEAKVGATVHGALAVVIVALALGLALVAGAAALVVRRRSS